MRKDQRKTENNFNIFLIVVFLISSTSIVQLIFWRRNPIEYSETKDSKITQYNMATAKGPVTKATYESVNITNLLTEIYKEKKSVEAGIYTEPQAKLEILKDERFRENGNFSKAKFSAHLQHMSKIIEYKIETHDYIQYVIKNISNQNFNLLINHLLRELKIPELIYNNINLNESYVIEGYSLLPQVTLKLHTFTKKEIKAFIQEEKHKKVRAYTIGEQRSGVIIRVKLGSYYAKVLEATKYYLNHVGESNINANKLKKFLQQVYMDSKGFTQPIDCKFSFRNQNLKNSVPLDDFITIEEFVNVNNNRSTELLFETNNPYKKNFGLQGDSYMKVIVTEITPAKETQITQEFLDNTVLPTMEAYRIRDAELAWCYNKTIHHNSKQTLLKANNAKVTFNSDNGEYISLCFAHIGDAFVLTDGFGNPYIFVVTGFSKRHKFRINDGEVKNFLNKMYGSFMREKIFFTIFERAYHKLKNNLQA